ncbi:MAG: aldo/keto reductase [Alphaproteobacteria bacterium]|nr:aldo/keto reductase [Alphaproteobacteria bacterium]
MDRRTFINLAAATSTATAFTSWSNKSWAAQTGLLTRKIPSSGEAIPVLGMGTWITFNVGKNKTLRDKRLEVLSTFFAGGGGMIDSSPMYGSSEEVVGYCLAKLPPQKRLFTATKVWTVSKWMGERQMQTSEKLWKEDTFDLIQIHNLVDWEVHMDTLNTWKSQGRLRHTGITTSHGRRHKEFERVAREHRFDFAQFTYNIEDREAENRLLPMAADRGMGVIINRPFQRGALIKKLNGKPLPAWAAEFGAQTWPQFLLKFVISHPAVTCAIPATSNPAHMRENLEAGRGALPDEAMRIRMADYVHTL